MRAYRGTLTWGRRGGEASAARKVAAGGLVRSLVHRGKRRYEPPAKHHRAYLTPQFCRIAESYEIDALSS